VEDKYEEDKKVPSVRADESQPNCVACNEKFELFWDADKEDWMYKNAVVASDGFIYHTQCHAEDEADLVPVPTEIGKKREFPEGVSIVVGVFWYDSNVLSISKETRSIQLKGSNRIMPKLL